MVLIDFLKKSWTIVHGFDRFFTIVHGFHHIFEKSWTIVHGFDRFFEKNHGLWFMVLIDFLEKVMDYSSWF